LRRPGGLKLHNPLKPMVIALWGGLFWPKTSRIACSERFLLGDPPRYSPPVKAACRAHHPAASTGNTAGRGMYTAGLPTYSVPREAYTGCTPTTMVPGGYMEGYTP